MDGPVLVVDGLSRRFGPRVVLSDVRFVLEAGHAAAVIGPNGAGKTTLLRCVVGADRPDDGRVLIDGRPLRETDSQMRAAVASALDDVEFFPDLSVAEHLDLLARAHGAQPATECVLAEIGLATVADRTPVSLSSGERRRLALASCLVRPRRLLVLDEPEQRLDLAGRRWLIERLQQEKAEGCAVLFASHDAAVVKAVGDCVIELGG
ncbi:MAG: ABC transporter ATP-binding protein [Pseudonocardiaceae bacterium]